MTERMIGYRVEARRDADRFSDAEEDWTADYVTITDTFALREAAIQCARLLEQAGVEVVGVWEVRDYSDVSLPVPDPTERIPIDWRAK